jgi:hypothetical protein
VARGAFDQATARQSSTFRELWGLREALQTFASDLAGQEVLLRTDSQAAVRIWARGGSQREDDARALYLHVLILEIDRILREHGILAHWQWIPRDANELADFWSKFRDPGDWRLSESAFARLEELWGPHSVNRMASAENTRLPTFYSRYYCKGAAGIDCFAVRDWSGHNNYVHPDFNMIGRVLDHLRACRATATLIVPEWPSQPWWPILHPAANEGIPSPVLGSWVLPQGALIPAHAHTIVGTGKLQYRILALRVSFATPVSAGAPAMP